MTAGGTADPEPPPCRRGGFSDVLPGATERLLSCLDMAAPDRALLHVVLCSERRTHPLSHGERIFCLSGLAALLGLVARTSRGSPTGPVQGSPRMKANLMAPRIHPITLNLPAQRTDKVFPLRSTMTAYPTKWLTIIAVNAARP